MELLDAAVQVAYAVLAACAVGTVASILAMAHICKG
jgi:hypothetical protein